MEFSLRVRTLSRFALWDEICTCLKGNKTVPSQSEDVKGTSTLSSEDFIRIRLYKKSQVSIRLSSFIVAERTKNVHFLVARTEADLSDYSSSVCHEYPGPAMATSQVEWLPCYPIRRARFFKITTSTPSAGYFNFAQLEIYGFQMQLD